MVRIVLILAGAAVAALMLPALVLPLAGPAQAARVIFLGQPDIARLPEGVTIDRWDGTQVVLVGVDARAARQLYAGGP